MTPSTANTAFLLLVEDDPNVLALVSSTLRLSGYHVRTAITRAEIFAQLDSGLCAAMLLDLGLPGDDGIQIARAVRERSAVPILMLTGRRGIHERVKGLEAGADDYLLKPFAPEELVARVRAVLRRAPKPAESRKREIALHIGEAQSPRGCCTARKATSDSPSTSSACCSRFAATKAPSAAPPPIATFSSVIGIRKTAASTFTFQTCAAS